MNDYQAIANLIAEYTFVTDAADFAALGKLFADGAISLNGGPFVQGAEAVEQFARETLVVHGDGTLRTRHFTTNLHIEIDADTATGQSYLVVFQQLDDFPLQPIAVAHYRDQFGRIDGRWCFLRREVITDFFGDTSHHVHSH